MKKATDVFHKAYVIGSVWMLLNLTSCYQFFQGKIPMDITAGGQNISLETLLSKKEEQTELDIPAQIYVSKDISSSKVTVSWNPVEGASSYRLERAVLLPDNMGNYSLPDESDFSLVRGFVYSTSYEDTILIDPSYSSNEYKYRFFYRVMAQNYGNGLESSFTFPAKHIVSYKTKPDGSREIDTEKTELLRERFYNSSTGWLFKAPSEIDASRGKSETEIELRWNPVEGASNFTIYRGTAENGTSMEKLVTVKSNITRYRDIIAERDQGIEFYYKVYAENSLGETSVSSPLAMGYSLQKGAPVTPENVETVNSNGNSISSIKVRWNPVQQNEGSTITYALYRNSNVDPVYTLIKTNIPQRVTEYTDPTVRPGIVYRYFVQSISTDIEGNRLKSSFSTSEASGYLLSAPEKYETDDYVSSVSSGKKVLIMWSPALGSDVNTYSYNIKYSDSENGIFETLETVAGNLNSETGYLSCVVDKKPFYKISTVFDASAAGESKDSPVFAPNPAAPENVRASKCKKLSDEVFIPNKNNVYPVEITWSKPEGENPAGYNVYRSTKPDSAFRKITETPVTGTFFVDDNDTAKSGVYYYYKVVSLNLLGQGKKSNDTMNDPSHDARGYGAITREQWFREYNSTVINSQSKLTLMHKPNDLDKIGSETVRGDISGTLGYKAAVAGLGAEITMPYRNYADKFIDDDYRLGVKFLCDGNTDTTSNMSGNGHMHETVRCYSYWLDLTKPDALVDKTFENLSASARHSLDDTGDSHYLVGMYPGYAKYNELEIKGGAAGGGHYLVETYELNGTSSSFGTVILPEGWVDYLVGEEVRK